MLTVWRLSEVSPGWLRNVSIGRQAVITASSEDLLVKSETVSLIYVSKRITQHVFHQ